MRARASSGPELATAIGIGLFVGLLTYGIPYASQPAASLNATTGPVHTLAISDEDQVEETFTWRTELALPASPSAYETRISVPYHVTVDPSSGNSSQMHLAITANGHTIHEHRQLAGFGGLSHDMPPGSTDTSALRAGTNELSAALTVDHWPELEGDNEIQAGPFIVEAHAVDEDGDGIVDAGQPAKRLHTGAVAMLTGAISCVVSLLGVRWWQRGRW